MAMGGDQQTAAGGGGGNGIHFLCQRCQQPLRLSNTLYSMDEHTLAELSLPISPAQNIDVESQVCCMLWSCCLVQGLVVNITQMHII